MNITFDPFRTAGLPGFRYIKPELMFQEVDMLTQADLIVFPEYWQLNPLLHGLKKRIFPSPETYLIGHNKVEMTRMMQMFFPHHIPYTKILGNRPHVKEEILSHFSYPFIAKNIKDSMGNGVFLIENENDLNQYLSCHPVLYFQEYIPIEKDLRIVWVGGEVVDAYWRIRGDHPFLTNVAQGGSVSKQQIPPEALLFVESIAKKFNINHAGFDVLFYNNHLYFLEFNVLFGNQYVDQERVKQTIRSYLTI